MNQVAIFGRFTKDPEMRFTQQGKAVANFSLAVNRYGSNEADFFDCVAWEKQAENIANSCKKGHRLLIWGRLQQDHWTDNGQNRTAIKIILTGFSFIEPPPQQAQVQQPQPPAGPPAYGPPPGYYPPGYGQPAGYPGYVPPPGGYPPQGQPPVYQGQQLTGQHTQPPTRQQGNPPEGPPTGPPHGQAGFQFPGQQGGFSGNMDDIPF